MVSHGEQIHRNGARHQAALESLREKKRRLHEEIQKRIATGSGAVPSTVSASISTPASGRLEKKVSPLLTATQSIKTAVLLGQVDGGSGAAALPGNVSSLNEQVRPYVSKRNGMFFQSKIENVAPITTDNVVVPESPQSLPQEAQQLGSNSESTKGVAKSSRGQKRKNSERPVVTLGDDVAWQELRRVAQQEMKWKEAGWRRDAGGHWSRDENVILALTPSCICSPGTDLNKCISLKSLAPQ